MQIHRLGIIYTVDIMDLYNSSNLVHAESSCSPSQSPAVPQSEPPTLGSFPAPVPSSPLEHTHTLNLYKFQHQNTHKQKLLLISTLKKMLSCVCSLATYLRQRMASVSLHLLLLWVSSCSQGCGTLYLWRSQTGRCWSRGTTTLMVTTGHRIKKINHKD